MRTISRVKVGGFLKGVCEGVFIKKDGTPRTMKFVVAENQGTNAARSGMPYLVVRELLEDGEMQYRHLNLETLQVLHTDAGRDYLVV